MLFQLVETILCAYENKQILLFTVNIKITYFFK